MKKSFQIILKILGGLLSVAVMALVIAWMAGAFREKVQPGQSSAPRPTAKETGARHTVVAADRPVIEEAAGSVVARDRVMVAARIMATIQAVNVRAGDIVEEGQTLIILDSRELQTRVTQRSKELESAKARETVAQYEFERQNNLFESKVISRQKLDEVEASMRTAQAEVERAQEALEEARVAMTYAQIEAPKSGRIIERLAEPGDMAGPGQPLLQIYDPTSLQLEAAVRESLAVQLRRGQKLQARIDALDTTIDTTVQEIIPQSEIGSRSFRIKVALPTNSQLYTGMFGRLLIPVGTEKIMTIPSDSVHRIGQNTFVYIVGKENRLERRMITLGKPEADGSFTVLSGVEPNDQVYWES